VKAQYAEDTVVRDAEINKPTSAKTNSKVDFNIVHLNVQVGSRPRYKITPVENHHTNSVNAAGSKYWLITNLKPIYC
jgi:hypothetical protein